MRYACALLALTLSAVLSPAPASELEPLWRVHVDPVRATSVVYGGDGRTLLVSGLRGEVTLWVAGESAPRLRYKEPERVGLMIAARFADGGRTVAALGGMDRKLWRWDAATAAALPAIDLGAVLKADEVPFRFHVDAPGALGLVASQKALHLVPLDGRSPPRVIAAPEAGGGPFGNVADVALAPDGTSACAIDVANRIHCYRTSNGQLIASLTYELDIKLQSIAILGNGALAAGTAESQVARWKSTKGDYVNTSGFDRQSPANAVAAFPSQTFFALGRYDGKIHVLSPDLGNRAPRIELLGAKGPVGMMAINAAGQLAAAAGHEIIVWDIGAELTRLGAKP